MKRVKRILTHKRHWVWYGFTLMVSGAGMAQQLFDPRSNPAPYLLIGGFSLVGGFVAWYCKPQDESDGD